MVFGQVIDGSNVVKSIENQKADARSKPYSEVRVANCGELVLQKKGRYSSHTHTHTGLGATGVDMLMRMYRK